jgi:uncharacterized protein with HEPN domain
MLPREARKLLFDVLSSAETIINAASDRSEVDYANDRLFRSACQWEFTVIGEAISRLRRDFPDVARCISEYERVIAFRNQLVHGYDVVRHDVTWRIIDEKLPIRQREVIALLAEPETK